MASVSVDGTSISYRLEGPSGAPVVMLSNALGTHHGMWDCQMRALTGRFRVLRYDTRGHGASAVPPGPYELASLGHDALALLDALGLPSVSFCGLSLGGMTGLWLAAHAPGRLQRLVVSNTSSFVGQPQMWNARIEAVHRGGMAAVTDAIIERWFTEPFRAAAPAEVERIREMLLACPADGYAACAAAVRDMDLREDLQAIVAPTLVICGARDAGTPPEHSRVIAQRLRDARVLELPAAHMSNIEARDAFTMSVLDFFET